jgi:ComF family protein
MREALARLAGKALAAALLTDTRCPGCGRAVDRAPGGTPALCADCLAASAPDGEVEADVPCPGCGEYPPAPQETAILCGRCREKPRPWGRVLVYGRYGGELKEMILAYKFQHRLDLGRQLMEYALAAYARGVAAHPEVAACEGIVPVPLHGRRLLARGFNQSREIARLLSARRGLPIWQDALRRVRRTVPQMELAREARAENIKGAFAADARLLAGRGVLLLDDIMTTGATIEECARAMLQAGAARVDVLVLARA